MKSEVMPAPPHVLRRFAPAWPGQTKRRKEYIISPTTTPDFTCALTVVRAIYWITN